MKIILTTIAAAMMSTSAYAACSDIPNPTRFNPQELSEYQECWLDEHKADEIAGILGSLAWVRLNDMYFSAPITLIAKSKGQDWADKFFAAIEPQVFEAQQSENEARIVELEKEIEIVERIVEDTTRIEELEAEVADLKAQIVVLKSVKDTLSAEISYLKDTKIAGLEHTISEMQKMIDNRDNTITALKAGLNTTLHYAQHIAWALEVDVNAKDGLTWAETLVMKQQIEAMKSIVAANGVNVTNVELNGDGDAILPNSADLGDVAFNEEADEYYVYVPTQLNASSGEWTMVGTSHAPGNLNATFKSVLISQVQAVSSTLGSALESAYDRGFNDGYETGYKQGYADGFADAKGL